LIEDRDLTTALPRPNALDSADAAGLGCATPHASPRLHAADDVIIKICYYGRQSILFGRRSGYSYSTHILELTSTHETDVQSPASYGHFS